MVTDLYWADRFGEEVLRYARIKDPVTEAERLVEPYELEDPNGVEVGDENAYKVSLFTNQLQPEYEGY